MVPDLAVDRLEVTRKLLDLGYTHVTVDLPGFRSGCLDEAPGV